MSPSKKETAKTSHSESKALSFRGISRTDLKKLDKAATEFEAIMIEQLLKSTKSKTARELLGGGMGEEFFEDHLIQERSKILAEKGGLGIAKIIKSDILSSMDRDYRNLVLKNPVLAEKKLKAYLDQADKKAHATEFRPVPKVRNR